jgi:hypothetical protein
MRSAVLGAPSCNIVGLQDAWLSVTHSVIIMVELSPIHE